MGMSGMAFHLTNWSGWREAHIWCAIGLAVAARQALLSGTSYDATEEMSASEYDLAPSAKDWNENAQVRSSSTIT